MIICFIFVLTSFMLKRVLELTTCYQPKCVICKMRRDDELKGMLKNITKNLTIYNI